MNNRVIELMPSTGPLGISVVANSANIQGLFAYVIVESTSNPEWAVGVWPIMGGDGIHPLERGFNTSTEAYDRMIELADQYF